jgi:iron(III) transport system substrate-binding protein
MALSRVLIAGSLALILGLPMLLGRCSGSVAHSAVGEAATLIVITPHVQQIREEFARAFSAWHEREHGTPVRIDYRTVGGTSEIIRALQARFQAALAAGRFELTEDGRVRMDPGAVDFDLMFGGGTYDHGRLKAGVTHRLPDGTELSVPMSVSAGFEQERLDGWFGENRVGAGLLYDPDQYWIGTALSGFGVVYNRDLTRELLGRDDLSSFADLADPRLAGWVALADPRQSGSITTAMDAILSGYGWERGWRTLRAIGANTRYFTNSSTKPPIDVSQGEAAAGLAIDFYGRTQSQVVMRPGQTPDTARVGYVDPPGEVSIDADPVSIIRGGPSPELARRFVEFTLTEEGQALWNFPALDSADGADNPVSAAGVRLGPVRYELRRMPVRRVIYDRHAGHLIDKVDPFAAASDTPSAGWRTAIGVMMGAFAVDNHARAQRAWRALAEARAAGVDSAVLAEAEARFYAFPTPEQVERHWTALFGSASGGVSLPRGALLPFTPENYARIRGAWRDAAVRARLEVVYTRAFAENYEHVTDTLREAARPAR